MPNWLVISEEYPTISEGDICLIITAAGLQFLSVLVPDSTMISTSTYREETNNWYRELLIFWEKSGFFSGLGHSKRHFSYTMNNVTK